MQAQETERLLQHFVKEDAVLRAYVHAATRNHQDTDDILQEVWRTLTVKLDQFDETRSFRAWAMGVARLQVLKWRQSLARTREYPSETVLELLADTAVQHADELDFRSHYLEQCLTRLAAGIRKMMAFRYIEGFSAREIGVRLGRSSASVDMALSRARKVLRDCISEHVRQELRSQGDAEEVKAL